MADSQKDKKALALATYSSLSRAIYELDLLLNGQSECLGLSPSQYRVLEYLLFHGPMATGELAEKVMFGDSTISVVTKNLQRAGLLARRADENDGRKTIVQLTADGKELVQSIFPKRAKALRARMCVLGKREQENLTRLCVKLAEGDAVKFLVEMTIVDRDDEE